MKDLDYRLQLFTYGPFEIPKKDKYLIVGSGPSSGPVLDYIEKNPSTSMGIFSLNCTIQTIKHTDISIHSHYEDVYTSWDHFYKSSLIFLPNPMSVGYRCLPIDTANLLNHNDMVEHFSGRIRFFKKEEDIDKSQIVFESLYANKTIATAALDLLIRNGHKEVYFCGIDGGEDAPRAKQFENIKCYRKKYRSQPGYDRCVRDFHHFAKKRKVKLTHFGDLINESVGSHIKL